MNITTVSNAYTEMKAGTNKKFFIAGFQIFSIMRFESPLRGETFFVSTYGGNANRRGYYEVEVKG